MCIPLNVESEVLKKHEDEFFNVVNPKLHLLQLKRKKGITEALISKIETADSEDARIFCLSTCSIMLMMPL